MSFRNFDNYYQDYDYGPDTSQSPPFRRSGSPLPSRTSRCRENFSPPRSTRPVIGDDGWEVLPAELLDPSNWGLPPSSLNSISEDSPTHQDTDEAPVRGPKMYPGGPSRIFPGSGMGGGVMQFYPDHDPDLINTNQLDGMPYVLQSSSINAIPKVVVNAAYNASSSRPKKLTFSQRWEEGLLEMAHQNPETLRNYSRIFPGKRGCFKSFGELHGDNEGGQGGMGSSGGTVPGPNFGILGPSRGRGQKPASAIPPSTPGYKSGVPGQPLSSGFGGGSTPGYTSGGPGQPLSSSGGVGGQRHRGCGRGSGNTLPTIHETPPILDGAYGPTSSSKAAARDAALWRNAASKVEQMRSKAELKREEYMKEIRQHEKAAAKKVKLQEEEADLERVKLEKLDKDREARSRKEMEWIEKSKDVRSLAAEAAARRDTATKDIQKERAKIQRERRKREEREKEERVRARAAKKREEQEKYRLAMEKRQRDVVAREAKARDVKVKSKDARQLAREAAERRFAATEREKQVEERSKNSPAPKKDEAAQSLVCEDCGKSFASEAQPSAHADISGPQSFAEIKPGLKAGPVKPAAKPTSTPSPTPIPVKKATRAPKATSAKTPAKAPEKKTLPPLPAPKSAPKKASPPSSPTESEEEKLTPRERVRLAMARREAAIRALPAEEPSSGDEELVTPPPTPNVAPVGLR